MKEIEGTNVFYLGEDLEIYRLKNGAMKKMKQCVKKSGHNYIETSEKGKKIKIYLHNVIAFTVNGIPEHLKDRPKDDLVVHHIDGNPSNNMPSNLEIMTRAEHMRLHQTGRKKSEEEIEKNRLSHIGLFAGEKNPMYGKPRPEGSGKPKKSIAQIDIKTNEIITTYSSLTEASKKTDIDKNAISNCARGKSKTSGGYKWVYLN